MNEDVGSPHPSARPFIIIPPIIPTSLNPLRFSTSFHFSPPFQPLTLFLEQKQREWREAAVEKWKRQGVTNSKRWRTQPIWINMRRFCIKSVQPSPPSIEPLLDIRFTLAPPSLHPHSILAGPWHHPYYQSPNPSTRICPVSIHTLPPTKF